MLDVESVVAAIITGASNHEIAAKFGKSVRTISRWKNDPKVKTEVQKQRAALAEAALNRLSADLTSYSKTISEIASNPDVAPQTRIYAIATGASLWRDFSSRIDVEERIKALEEAVSGLNWRL